MEKITLAHLKQLPYLVTKQTTMIKTIKEWLQELPSPWKEAALEQADKEDLLKEVSSMSEALEWFVDWHETKEGVNAWGELNEHYADLESQVPPKYPQHLLKKDTGGDLDYVKMVRQENETLRKQLEELQEELQSLKEQAGKIPHKYPLGYIDRDEFKIIAQTYNEDGDPIYFGCYPNNVWKVYKEDEITPCEQSPSRDFPTPPIIWPQEE